MKHVKHISAAVEDLKEGVQEKAAELRDQAQDKAEAVTGTVNAYVEKTAEVTPSLLFAGAALLSIAASLILQLRGKRHWGLFVGHWAPTFLLFGLYNKLSKTVGAA